MQTLYPQTFSDRKPAAATPHASETRVHPDLAHLETPQAILTPTLNDTLAYWRFALSRRGIVAMSGTDPAATTVKFALREFAKGRACGTAHVGYRRHRGNTTELIRRGVLIPAGLNAYGAPMYRLGGAR